MSIFVIGMHRSGTSLVADVLDKLGVHFGGEGDLLPANAANEQGYFEHQRALALNEALASANNVGWRTLPALSVAGNLNGLDDYVTGVRGLIAELSAKQPWGVKDPRLSFFLPLWRGRSGARTAAIVCLRRPEDVVHSLVRRNQISPPYAAALWELYTLAALQNSNRFQRAIVVYEDLVTQPEESVSRIANLVETWEGVTIGDEQRSAAIARVRPELDHSSEGSSFRETITDDQRALYERLAAGQTSRLDSTALASRELVRLEQAHQNAKLSIGNLRNELDRSVARFAEEKARLDALNARLAELLQWASLSHLALSPPTETPAPPFSPELALQALQKIIHDAGLVAAMRPHTERATAELVAAKDERIAWRDAELGRLVDRVAEQEKRESAARQALDDLRQRCTGLQNEVAAEQARADTAQTEAVKSREALSELGRTLDAMRIDFERAQRKLTDTEAQLSLREQESAAARADMARELTKAANEVKALRQALQTARSTTIKTIPAAQSPSKLPMRNAAETRDQRVREEYRRRFKAMQESIKAIDDLLSPPLGRFAIPVRRIRGQLVRLRAIIVSELEAP